MTGASHEKRAARAASMYVLYARGESLAEVGRAFGVSRERVRQVLREAGFPLRSNGATRQLQRARDVERREEIIAAWEQLRDADEVARRLGVRLNVVKEVVRHDVPASKRRKPRRGQQRYSREELLARLELAHRETGDALTEARYSAVAAVRGGSRAGWPVPQTFHNRFGSWSKAQAAAGIPLPLQTRAGRRRFEVDDCVAAVRRARGELGHAPSSTEYQRIAAGSPELPSVATVLNRCGTWFDALRLAGL